MIFRHCWFLNTFIRQSECESALTDGMCGSGYDYDVMSVTPVPPSVYNQSKGPCWIVVARAIPLTSERSSVHTRVAEVYFSEGKPKTGNSTMC